MAIDFMEENENENTGDILRPMREDDTAGDADSDEHHCSKPRAGEFEANDYEKTGYLHGLLGAHLESDVGRPSRRGLSYVVYSTDGDDLAEKLVSLLSRFVRPCSIIEVPGPDRYTYGCWLRESEIEEIECSLPMSNITHVDWDEQLRQLLLDEDAQE